MKLSTLTLSIFLGLWGTASLAAPPASTGAGPAGANPPAGGHCQSHSQDCAQLAQKFDQWCSANADKCTGLKAHIEKRREFCEQNKDKCEAMRDKMRSRTQQRCQANPNAPHCHDKLNPPGEDDNGGDDDDTGA